MLLNLVRKGQSLLLLSFSLLILIGMGLFMLPGILRAGGTLTWTDALFMSASCICVTGLSVVDVSSFTLPGQILVALLVQCGGIGIMTLSASILLALGHGLSFSDSMIVSDRSSNFFLSGPESFTRSVIRYVFFSEFCAFLLFLPGFLWQGNSVWQALWNSLFLAVSGFCNAGFTPFPGSMCDQNRWLQWVLSLLIIQGGLGVYVIYDLGQFFRKRKFQLRLHSKVVLAMTVCLLAGGTVLFWGLGRLEGAAMPWADAWFLSVTSRTAGFSTLAAGKLSDSCQTLLMILMLIGGAPGSTCGGIKVSTVALALAGLLSVFQGNREVLLFHRSVSGAHVLRAFCIIVLFLLLCCSGTLALQALAPMIPHNHSSFYVVSALSTTGLDPDGMLMQLPRAAKILISLMMFAGRIGPFTIMLFFFGREKQAKIHRPEERIIIG